MNKIIIATKNKGKIKEFENILNPYNIEVLSLLDLKNEEIEEYGLTFEENAKIKSEAIANKYNCLVVSDDSGLVVDGLNGKPGIYSARYASKEKNDLANIYKVLYELKGNPNRNAKFVCALAVSRPNHDTVIYKGEIKGVLLEELVGEFGFGYDPIFYVPEYKMTTAEMNPKLKNSISHRGQAINKFIKDIEKYI